MSKALQVLGAVVAVVVVLAGAAWLALRGPDIPYETLEARYAGPGSRYVDLPGGVRLHVEEAGKPGGPPLVLLHGYGDSYTSWSGWVAALGGKYQLLCVDLPGHGLTRAPAGYVISSSGYAGLLEAYASARGLQHFALAGNSMGGGVAWQYALLHPERLTALVLVDAAGWPLAPTRDLPLAFRILQYSAGRWLLAHIDNRPLIEEGLKKDVHDPAVITQAFVDRWAEFQRAPGHRAILMSATPGSLAVASERALATLTVPTLVLHGEADALIGVDSGRRFAAAIPGAKLITYPAVGHLPQVEIPARSAADVDAFLDSLAAAH